ncbi:hypothetical protein LF599_07390 [Pseudodesulfovibrio thermohalotolerans]|uniref:hypothetical protein n=1 Tax=Pseudodesulfovibrio thermohalotolerans TaxID=2880651 RepID=UPI002442944B|nr:hypothetical protein [Pseudodesulfovibrio thermohalotolerans]WFS63978.1 hypothetical protein LF599_07390 [Pseudodesulfovibrio thermohalotolerans]
MGKESWFFRIAFSAKRLVARAIDSATDAFCDWADKKTETLSRWDDRINLEKARVAAIRELVETENGRQCFDLCAPAMYHLEYVTEDVLEFISYAFAFGGVSQATTMNVRHLLQVAHKHGENVQDFILSAKTVNDLDEDMPLGALLIASQIRKAFGVD